MSRTSPSFSRTLPLLLALSAVASCASEPTTRPMPASRIAIPDLGGGRPALVQCEAPSYAASVSEVIGPLGGTLAVGNTSVVIPENAVLVPTTFRLTVPASPLVEISVKAGDAEHYEFLEPVLVTIDYGRCAASLSLLTSRTAWHIDEDSKEPIENMSAVDEPLAHTISFYTGHLSGYAVADNNGATTQETAPAPSSDSTSASP